jgi:hypothetical protein
VGDPVNLKELLVREASHEDASFFIPKWHYSGIVPSGFNIFFGVEHGEMADLFSREFYAMAAYGVGSNPFMSQSLSELTGLVITDDNCLELRRLCRSEPKQDIPLTWFLSRCHKLLKRRGYKYVVSFSDPSHGHTGGIYKAANFAHLGQTQAIIHNINEAGEIIHRRIPYHHKRRMGYPDGVGMEMARKDLGLTKIKTPPKDRWFLKL